MNTVEKTSRTAAGICLAAVLWTIMFSPRTAPHINFWAMMTFSGVILTVYTTWAVPRWWKDIRMELSDVLIGAGLAAALWGIFWLGDLLSSLMFDFARPQVDSIYGMKAGSNPLVLSLLLLLIIGPAEEIFWRGYGLVNGRGPRRVVGGMKSELVPTNQSKLILPALQSYKRIRG